MLSKVTSEILLCRIDDESSNIKKSRFAVFMMSLVMSKLGVVKRLNLGISVRNQHTSDESK